MDIQNRLIKYNTGFIIQRLLGFSFLPKGSRFINHFDYDVLRGAGVWLRMQSGDYERGLSLGYLSKMKQRMISTVTSLVD